MEIDDITGFVLKVSNVYAPDHLPIGISFKNGIADRAALNDVTGLGAADDAFSFSQIDEYGINDGRAYIKKSSISQISCNSQKERSLLDLWNNRNFNTIKKD